MNSGKICVGCLFVLIGLTGAIVGIGIRPANAMTPEQMLIDSQMRPGGSTERFDLANLNGKWAVGSVSVCTLYPYAVSILNNPYGASTYDFIIRFVDPDGRIDEEKIKNSVKGTKVEGTWKTETLRSSSNPRGTVWDYSSIGTSLLSVHNVSQGRSFRMFKCPPDGVTPRQIDRAVVGESDAKQRKKWVDASYSVTEHSCRVDEKYIDGIIETTILAPKVAIERLQTAGLKPAQVNWFLARHWLRCGSRVDRNGKATVAYESGNLRKSSSYTYWEGINVTNENFDSVVGVRNMSTPESTFNETPIEKKHLIDGRVYKENIYFPAVKECVPVICRALVSVISDANIYPEILEFRPTYARGQRNIKPKDCLEEKCNADELTQYMTIKEKDNVAKLWEIYSKRQKSLIEQVLNYSTTALIEGYHQKELSPVLRVGWSSSAFWMGSGKCTATLISFDPVGTIVAATLAVKRIESEIESNPTMRPMNAREWQDYLSNKIISGQREINNKNIEITKLNIDGFRIEEIKDCPSQGSCNGRPIDGYRFGDEQQNFTVPNNGQSMIRMKSAWQLAFKECPGTRTPF